MVGRHILEDIVGRVAQTTKDDHVSQEIAPHTVTPCDIAVCRSTINAGSDRWPVRLQTRAVVISTETESGFITEDDTSPVCHTPSCLRSAKIQSTLPMMGVSGKRLSGRRLLKPTSVSRLLMVSLDGTGCLEGAIDDPWEFLMRQGTDGAFEPEFTEKELREIEIAEGKVEFKREQNEGESDEETEYGDEDEDAYNAETELDTDQEEMEEGEEARRRFVEWAQNEIAVVPDFHKRILFSDEAHFWLNGYVNKQNCRIWSEANPQVYVETPLYPEKLTVWCVLWADGIIGPYFFKNDEGHNVTVNGDRYRAMITNFFIPELNNHDVQELWFQQDGATCPIARATIDLLKDTFGDRLISRFGPVNWPPRSCDLTPLDYFLWGYVKSLVYADKPQTLDHLEDIIRRVIADIRPQMLEKVIENWTSRLDYIRASRGSPMPEIIFKM
ncbi:transposable element Tc3 transposase [Trichonephila clavipes]|uniref:Transposable element Tc3 transposase n=1 Tax=Trichonephila clavipes TaxID=2585209 RepID=A0A8X6W5H4_TRICX|nr:transposable element Tc3 transposase [Trichonephila clavipes]